MTGIKVLLVTSFICIALWAFRNRTRVGLRAGARVAVLAIALLAVVAVIQPDLPQWAAEQLGVTRGTDLILYVLIVVFALVSIGNYLRFKEMEHRFAVFVRQIALAQVVEPMPPAPPEGDQAAGAGEPAG